MNDLDQQISKAHTAAEQTELQARQLEARICAIPGASRYLPVRRYGSPVDPKQVGRNVTLRSLIDRHDPQLAAFLGIATGAHLREQEAAAQREAMAARMAAQTEALRSRNAAQRQVREERLRSGRNPSSGLRMI